VQHKNEGVFKDLKSPFRATRYHSLAIETPSVPEELLVTATTESGVIMGVKHKSAPIEGVQFHPESVLTEGGHRLLANWLQVTDPNESKKIEDYLKQIIKF
jgi:para-aminobenzoate synthetase component 2